MAPPPHDEVLELRAITQAVEGAVRGLEKLHDAFHALELTHTRDDTEVRALITSTRQWIGNLAGVLKGEGASAPMASQLLLHEQRLCALEVARKGSATVEAAREGARGQVRAQLIASVAAVLASLTALAVALLGSGVGG